MNKTELEKLKNKIIEEIAKNKDFKNVVKTVCRKNGYSNNLRITEDVEQEVLEKLLKKDAELVVEWYNDNEKRPLKVAVGIAKKQFLKNPRYINYNKHSFGEYISFTSNIFNDIEIEEDTKIYTPFWSETGDENDTDIDEQQHVIYTIFKYLDEDEKEFLNNIISEKKQKGMYGKLYKEKKEKLFEKVKKIAIDKKIKIIF